MNLCLRFKKMYFLKDPKKKLILGWSAKCGCSHVKKIFKFLTTGVNLPNDKHLHRGYHPIGEYAGYTVILVVRNPFERLVSGFLDKYRPNGPYLKDWQSVNPLPLTFRNFVDQLITGDFQAVNRHHFTPQLSEAWIEDIKKHDPLIVYDLKNIDYTLLNTFYQTTIPDDLIEFRGGHENTKTPSGRLSVSDLKQEDYAEERPALTAFYPPDIEAKVRTFYAADFAFFDAMGFNYGL
jgi:hypothetical protein